MSRTASCNTCSTLTISSIGRAVEGGWNMTFSLDQTTGEIAGRKTFSSILFYVTVAAGDTGYVVKKQSVGYGHGDARP